MKKLIQEIRNQPLHVRHIFMWTMVVITFSVIGIAWFEQTRKDFVALLGEGGRQPVENQRALAQASPSPKQQTPFQAIGNTFADLGANISEIISGRKTNLNVKDNSVFSPIPPVRLP